MADVKTFIRDINLNTSLNLASNKAVVTDFEGFNKNTGAWYNYTLSPLWRADYSVSSSVTLGNDTFSITNSSLYKNEKVIKDFTNELKANVETIEDNNIVAMSSNIRVIKEENSLVAYHNDIKYTVTTDYDVSESVYVNDFGQMSVIFYESKVVVFNGTSFQENSFPSSKTAFLKDNDVMIVISGSISNGTANVTYRNVNNSVNGTLSTRAVLAEGVVSYTANSGTLCFVQSVQSVYAFINTLETIPTEINGISTYKAVIDNSINMSATRQLMTSHFKIENGVFSRVTRTLQTDKTSLIQNGSFLDTGTRVGKILTMNSDRYLRYGLWSGIFATARANNDSYLYKASYQANNSEYFSTALGSYIDRIYMSTSSRQAIQPDIYIGYKGLFNSQNTLEFLYQDIGQFRLLYRQNALMGISVKGQLITNWYDIEENTLTVESDSIYYYSRNNNCWVHINVSKDNQLIMKNVADKILTNAICKDNAYNNELFTYSSGYIPYQCFRSYSIDAILIGNQSPWGLTKPSQWAASISDAADRSMYISFGIGAGYMNTNEENEIGPIWGSVLYKYSSSSLDVNLMTRDADTTLPESWDIYTSSDNTVLTYYKSVPNNKPSMINTEKSSYDPDYYNLPCSLGLITYIDSYSSIKYVKLINTSYQLMQFNNKPILMMQILSSSDNVQSFFVLQGQPYAVINGYIDTIEYTNNAMSSQTPIISVANMKFLGNTDKIAYFYAPMNKTIRSFTADNALNTVYEATSFSDDIKTYFDIQTDSIFVSLDDRSIVITPQNMYEIDKVSDNFSFGVSSFNDGTYTYSYYKQKGFEKQKLEVETQWYGVISPRVNMIVDCIYIELWDEEKDSGEFSISMDSLVNFTKSTNSKSFHIKKEDWDKETSTLYLRYQPKIQLASAFKLNISSDFAMKRLAVSYKQEVPTIAKNNI